MKLCLQDLIEWTGGEVKLAVMPPLDGELTPIERILLRASAIGSGDVFWCLAANRCDIELAFLRGAIGVVCANRTAEPWPGRFVLLVDDPVAGLQSMVEAFSGQLSFLAEQEKSQQASELKDLQLCAAVVADISPPSCDRVTNLRRSKPCRRHAA
jgi:hypothetical protein